MKQILSKAFICLSCLLVVNCGDDDNTNDQVDTPTCLNFENSCKDAITYIEKKLISISRDTVSSNFSQDVSFEYDAFGKITSSKIVSVFLGDKNNTIEDVSELPIGSTATINQKFQYCGNTISTATSNTNEFYYEIIDGNIKTIFYCNDGTACFFPFVDSYELENGVVTSHTRYNSCLKENQLFRQEYIYDTNGNIIELIDFDSNNSIRYREFFTYDNQINPLKNQDIRGFNLFIGYKREALLPPSKNNIISFNRVEESGNVLDSYNCQYQYDENSYPTSVRFFFRSGGISQYNLDYEE